MDVQPDPSFSLSPCMMRKWHGNERGTQGTMGIRKANLSAALFCQGAGGRGKGGLRGGLRGQVARQELASCKIVMLIGFTISEFENI